MTSDSTTGDELIVLGASPSTRGYLRDLWARREYSIAVPLSSVRSQHMDTLLGNLWHLVNPLLMIGVYYLVFGVIIETDRGVENFLAFLSLGVFIFRFSQNSIQQCASAITANEGLIRSIYFPRALLPIASVIEQVLVLLPSMVVLVAITLLSGVMPDPRWLVLPLILILQTTFNLGAGLIAARVTDTFRDFKNILPFVFRILFYLSGVIYSVDAYVESETLRSLFHANPLYAFLTLARWSLLGTTLPGTVVLSTVLWSLGLLVIGFQFFRAAEIRYGRG